MKILVYAPLFWPETGGIETISAQLLTALVQRGHQFAVVTAQGRQQLPEQMTYTGTPVYRFPMIEALQRKDLRQLVVIQRAIAALKQSFQPDLVHLHLGGPTPIAYFHLQTAHMVPAPLLVTVHNCFTACAGGAETVLGTCLRMADWIAASSATMLDDLLTVVPEVAPHAATLRYCLPLPAALPSPLELDAPRLLYLGRLTPEKGIDIALAAFQQLAANEPRLTLQIAGDGPARAALEAQAADYGLTERVHFLGNQPWATVNALLNQATLVLMPSRWREPFGLVALEAAQMARPVIAAQVGGLSEIIVHEQTGMLVEPENAMALAAAVATLLGEPDRLRQMGQAARDHALTHFGWETYVDTYEQLYTKLSSPTE